MKIKLKPFAALLAIAYAVPAWAQTHISLYGIVDAGLHMANTGNGTQINLASGIADGSRIGFKGTEELVKGYKAIFNLEARFETDTGESGNGYPTSNVGTALTAGLQANVPTALVPALQPARIVNPNNALFDRISMLGLITPGGAILLGRQYTPGYEILALSDTFETGTAGGWGNITASTGGFATTGVAIRANDALQFRIQTPNGFGAAIMYALSDTVNANARTGTGSINFSRRFWGANVKYRANGFNVGIGYNSEEDQVGNKSLTTWTLGGSYAIGNAKLFAGYHRMRNDNSVLIGAINSALLVQGTPLATAAGIAAQVGRNARIDAESYTLGMHYSIGSGRIMAAVSRTDDNLPANAQAVLYALGYNYYLSKRTDLYGIAAHVSNRNTAQYGLGGAGYTGGFTSQPGQGANALQIGIRHKF